jgi:uncharacterized protein YbjQ (UPF0145 family)
MSPLFHRRSEEERQAAKQAAQERDEAAAHEAERAAASLALIEEGRIPLVASERLQRFAGASAGTDSASDAGARTRSDATVFSSDLEVSEWSALARLDVRPITQVMGSSIYHVGWQPTYYSVPTEVSVLSDAYNECRRLALGRLLEEAATCAADAVVGLRIDQGEHDWAPGSVEFIALGTAVRLPETMRDAGGTTVLSDLSGQDFVQLCQAGVRPVGIAAHTSVHYVPASGQTQMAQSGWGSSWSNQELVDFSQGVYEAREKAMGFVTAQVRELGGDGIIGVELREHSRTYEVRRAMYESKDLQVTFHAMGTVVREDPTLASVPPQPPPLKVLSMS